MKKTLSAISALAVMIGLSTSCQKELAGGQEPAGNKPFTITASIADSGTKVSYAEDGDNNLTPSWVVGDVIIGFDGDGNTYGYSVTEVNTETKKATLAIITSGANAGGKTVNPANGTKMYMFYAPGKKPTDIGTKSLTVSLASQDKDVVPALMMASAEVTDNSLSLDFQNKTAIIGVKTPVMTTASKQYTSVALSGTGINTEVVFSLSGETLQAAYQTAGTITKTLDFTSDALTKEGPDVIYIVTCPLASAADLTFTFNGNEEYFKVAGATMEAGHYYYMTPTTGKQKFSITVDGSIANGSISTDKTEGTCAWGETVTVTATPATGYELATLTYTDSSDHDILSAKSFTMPKANVTVSGSFQKKDYAITPTGTGSGTYTVTGGTYTVKKSSTAVTKAQMGDVITVTPDPATGYSGGTVTVKKTGTEEIVAFDATNKTFTMPAADVTITVEFNHDSYTLTGTPSPTEGGSVTFTKGGATATVAYFGDEITIVSTPNTDYVIGSVSAKDASNASVTITDNTFTMPASNVTVEVSFTPDIPEGALAGKFSVSATKKVHFSKGNLVATINASGTPTAWKFAANQYDYIGSATANTSIGSTAGDVDLFGWSTDAASNNWGIHTKTSTTEGFTSGNFNDWGTAIDSKGTWRTLSKDEWQYLFNTRTASTVNGTANARYAKATVNSKAGVILLPDTYTHPEGVTLLTNINTADATFAGNTYDSANWAKIESAGAVFLPAAGRRDGSSVSGSGYYWSSTANGSDAYFVSFGNYGVNPTCGGGDRYYGDNVRLITESK